MLKIECIVRGYLSGSAWKEYQASGTMNGVPLPPGMQESQQLPQPVFTPSTKADIGDHDVNITYEDSCVIVGKEVAEQAREASLELYRMGAERALLNGIVIADTKFELGFIDGELAVCDEILTQDSSRFWPADQVTLGADAAVVRQAAGARLRRVARLEQDAARPADARRGDRRHPHPLHRGVRADQRPFIFGLAVTRTHNVSGCGSRVRGRVAVLLRSSAWPLSQRKDRR